MVRARVGDRPRELPGLSWFGLACRGARHRPGRRPTDPRSPAKSALISAERQAIGEVDREVLPGRHSDNNGRPARRGRVQRWRRWPWSRRRLHRNCSPTWAPTSRRAESRSPAPAVRLTCCWATAVPAPRRRTARYEHRCLQSRLEIVDSHFCSPRLIGFVDHEFPGIDEHHHHHSARERYCWW